MKEEKKKKKRIFRIRQRMKKCERKIVQSSYKHFDFIIIFNVANIFYFLQRKRRRKIYDKDVSIK